MMAGLFQVQWRSANEYPAPPGDWKTHARCATLEQAEEHIRMHKVDWAYPRVYVDPTEVSAALGGPPDRGHDYEEQARAWLVRAQGEARPHEVTSLAAELRTAAEGPARVLLAVEWSGEFHRISDAFGAMCPACRARPHHQRPGRVHRADCPLEAALRSAGLR